MQENSGDVLKLLLTHGAARWILRQPSDSRDTRSRVCHGQWPQFRWRGLKWTGKTHWPCSRRSQCRPALRCSSLPICCLAAGPALHTLEETWQRQGHRRRPGVPRLGARPFPACLPSGAPLQGHEERQGQGRSSSRGVQRRFRARFAQSLVIPPGQRASGKQCEKNKKPLRLSANQQCFTGASCVCHTARTTHKWFYLQRVTER